MPGPHNWKHFSQWVVPPVRSNDILWFFTHLHGGQQHRLPSGIPHLLWVWYAIWDTGRNVYQKLFKILGTSAMPNHRIRKLHSVRSSPSHRTLATSSPISLLQTLDPRSQSPLYIYVSPWHIKEIQERKRNNKISGLEAALSEVIPLHAHFSYRKISYSIFPFTFLITIYKHLKRVIWKTYNCTSCSSYFISLCHTC